MPLYEYVCEQDGTVLELMRPMSAADEPVVDPKGLGRRFVRRFSTFSAGSGSAGTASAGAGGGGLPVGGCCPCGKGAGGCRAG